MDAIAICSPCSAPEVFFASQETFPDSNYKRELYSDAITHLRVARAGAPLQPHTSHSDMKIDLIYCA